MKKIITIALLALFAVSCGDDDEQTQVKSEEEKQIETLVGMLNGTFYGELYSSAFNTTDHEDITFSPFSQPKKYSKFQAYGTADIIRYVNDFKDTPSYHKTCVYTFGKSYAGERTLSFYPCSEDLALTGSEDKRIITVVTNSVFKMRKYGLTDINDLTYTKE